jgi:hypothetical protein
MPTVRSQSPVKPDRVIEAGAEKRISGFRIRPERMRKKHRLCREVVGQICKPTSVENLRLSICRMAKVCVDTHPGNYAPHTITSRATNLVGGDKGPIKGRGERGLIEQFRRRYVGHRDRLDLCRWFRPLKGALGIQDRPDCLSRNNAPSGKAATISDAVHFVSNWLGVVAAPNEICPNRMRFQLRINRKSCGSERLGNYLTAIQSTPWISGAGTDVDIGPMW